MQREVYGNACPVPQKPIQQGQVQGNTNTNTSTDPRVQMQQMPVAGVGVPIQQTQGTIPVVYAQAIPVQQQGYVQQHANKM